MLAKGGVVELSHIEPSRFFNIFLPGFKKFGPLCFLRFFRSFSFHLLVYNLHHLQKLFLAEYPLVHKQPCKGFLLDNLGQEEFLKGYKLFRIKDDCHGSLR